MIMVSQSQVDIQFSTQYEDKDRGEKMCRHMWPRPTKDFVFDRSMATKKKEWPYAKIVYEKEGWDGQRSMRKNVQANVAEIYRELRIRSINGKKRKERPYAKIVYTSPRRSIFTATKSAGATRVVPLVNKNLSERRADAEHLLA